MEHDAGVWRALGMLFEAQVPALEVLEIFTSAD